MLSIPKDAHRVGLPEKLAQIPLRPVPLLTQRLGQTDKLILEWGAFRIHADHSMYYRTRVKHEF